MNPTLAIHTGDGASISIEGRGYAHRTSRAGQLWRVAGALLFDTDDEGYAWLDGAVGVWEGEFDAAQDDSRPSGRAAMSSPGSR
jgi:hypothetical protein